METKSQIESRLNQIPEGLEALRDHALSYLPLGSTIDSDNNVLIGHKPHVGPEAYVFTLFAPARVEWLQTFSVREKREIPSPYRELLLVTNGYCGFDLSLFGLAPSMQEVPPLLDRGMRQCYDLSLANRDWIREFEVEGDWLYFGGRALFANENLGYFMSQDGLVRALRYSGELLGEWSNFSRFLDEELTTAAAFSKTFSE